MVDSGIDCISDREMVEDWQGNGKLLHNEENGLIAIYFFAIEQQCGNGELLNNSQFLRDRATASPTFIGYSQCLSCIHANSYRVINPSWSYECTWVCTLISQKPFISDYIRQGRYLCSCSRDFLT